MTRTARRGPENKKHHEATEWNQLKSDADSLSSKTKAKPWKRDRGGTWSKKGAGKNKMTAEGKILHNILHKDHRREKRREKRAADRQAKKVCFKCRIPGHKVEDCLMDSSKEGTGICYKCGSTEHMSSACKSKIAPGNMPYASCYVCGKQGHISRNCPDNPRGLYPLGGGCKTCGSVEHFQRDCPEYLEKQGIGSKKVKTMTMETSVDAEDEEITDDREGKMKPQKKKQPKVVKF